MLELWEDYSSLRLHKTEKSSKIDQIDDQQSTEKNSKSLHFYSWIQRLFGMFP